MIIATLIAAAALPSFTGNVIKIHDGDGPLWCRSGEKIRVACIQAPNFESAEPYRRPDARRPNYTCDQRAAERSQRIMSGLTMGKRLSCQPTDKSYSRVVARCILPKGQQPSVPRLAAGPGQ